MKIFKKKFLEQITAAVLSSTISVSCVPMGVFAEESSSVSVETSDTLTEASQSELSETQISDTSPSSEPVSDTSDSQTDISTETESQDSSETPATSEETSVSESEGPIDEPQPVPDTYNIILNDLPEEIRAAYDIYINGMTENITVTKNKPFSIEIIPNGLSERTYQISNLKFGTYYPGGAIGQSSFSSKMTALSEMADENGNIFVNLEFSPVYIVSFNYNPEYGTIEGDIINDENPAGTVYIKGGQSIEFTAVPNENYRVSKVVIDGEEQSFTENDYIYECSSLTADRDYTIEIVFALNTFSVSSQTSGNGTVLISNENPDYDSAAEITIQPDENNYIQSVSVNGEAISAEDIQNGILTIPNISEDKFIDVEFREYTGAEKTDFSWTDNQCIGSKDGKYIFTDSSAISFSTDKQGLRLIDENGEIIAGDENTADIKLNSKDIGNITIKAVEIYYQKSEYTDMQWHTFTFENPVSIVWYTGFKFSCTMPEIAEGCNCYNSDIKVKINIDMPEFDELNGASQIKYWIGSGKPDKNNMIEIAADKRELIINADENNGKNLILYLEAEDHYGHTEKWTSEKFSINSVPPEIKVYSDDEVRSFYNSPAVFYVDIIDRQDTLNEDISAFSIWKDGKELSDSEKYKMISFTKNGDSWLAYVKFSDDGEYKWNISYTSFSGFKCENVSSEYSEEYFNFTVDTIPPKAHILVSGTPFDDILEIITFRFYSNDNFNVSISSEDSTNTNIYYFISHDTFALNEAELNSLPENSWEIYNGEFTISEDSVFAVYAKIEDSAGNYTYICSDGHIIEDGKPNIEITPEIPKLILNGVHVYNSGFSEGIEVEYSVEDSYVYSGLKSVEYWITADGKETKHETLFSYDNEKPLYNELVSENSGKIMINTAENNCSDVVLTIKAVDNAGNEKQVSQKFDIDITAPEITLSYDNNSDNNGNSYFNAARTATITIKERSAHFNEENAEIYITAVDAKGKPVEDPCIISDWKTVLDENNSDNDTHILTIEYSKDANYTFDITYTDMAGNKYSSVDTLGSVSPYEFTVDTTDPSGIVEVNKKVFSIWLNIIAFQYGSRNCTVEAVAEDATSPVKIEYTASNQNISSENLDTLPGWTEYEHSFNVEIEGKYIFYFRFTDYAGNHAYVRSDTYVIDETPPEITLTPPEPTCVSDGVNVYNDNFKDGISTQYTVSEKDSDNSGIKSIQYVLVVNGKEKERKIIYMDNRKEDIKYDITGNINIDVSEYYENDTNADIELKVIALDKTGNETEVSEKYIFDTASPEISLTPQEPVYILNDVNVYNGDSITVKYNVDEGRIYSGIKYIEYWLRVDDKEFRHEVLYDGTIYSPVENISEKSGIIEIDTKDSSSNNIELILKASDNAGNEMQISEKYIVDKTAPEITIKHDDKIINDNDIYNGDIKIDITVTDKMPSSEFKYIKYKIFDAANSMSDSGTLFDNSKNTGEISYSESDIIWNGSISVDSSVFNGNDILIEIIAADNAGNINEIPFVKKIDIDTTAPVISVAYDNNKDNNGNGYFNKSRTATITILENAKHFEKDKVQITVTGENSQGKINKTYTYKDLDKPDEENKGDTHTAYISFNEDANYTFSIKYTDKAGNKAEDFNDKFTVDTTPPTASITAASAEGRVDSWNSVVQNMKFGFWSKINIHISASYSDITSPITSVQYYKYSSKAATDAVNTLSRDELNKVIGWSDFKELDIKPNEQCTVYLKVTDKAGNFTYVSTNGLIADDNAPLEEMNAPEISITPQQSESGIYSGDIPVAVKVEEPLTGGTYSGLKNISYSIITEGTVTESGILYSFEDSEPAQSQLLKLWNGEVNISSSVNNSNDIVLEIYAEDNAGNVSSNSIPLSADITPPSIYVDFDNNTTLNGLFGMGRTARITITERNFSSDYVTITLSKDGVEYTQAVAWSNIGGSGDSAQWYAEVPFSDDGDYTFAITCTDLAANQCTEVVFAENTVNGENFTIDTTPPEISVDFDDKDRSPIGSYYKDTRTATITIKEHNFDKENTTKNIIITGDNDGNKKNYSISEWSDNGDLHTATIVFEDDAAYTFEVSCTDLAGNSAESYKTEFTLDTADPDVSIKVNDDDKFNAYSREDKVIPVIEYSDINFDLSKVSIEMTAINVTVSKPEISGNNVKFILEGESGNKLEWNAVLSTNSEHYGQILTFEDFPDGENLKEFDDIYTINVSVTDKSGRVSEKTMTFSINRYGSTYDISSVKDILGTYVHEVGDIVISEINPSRLKNYSIVVFKNTDTVTLIEGKDYMVTKTGDDSQWHEYTYTINSENFIDDGTYSIKISSEDLAGNASENTLDTKDSNISFGIDNTPPEVLVANLESNQTYNVDKLSVIMNADDNLVLSSVEVVLDKEVLQSWDSEQIKQILRAENPEERFFTFQISGDSTASHQLEVVCQDMAGNSNEKFVIEDFYVTTDNITIFKNWISDNIALVISAGVAVCLIVVLIVYIISRKKRSPVKN